MKSNNNYIIVALMILFVLVSCEEGFDEINTNPVRLTSVDPSFQLNDAIIASVPTYNNLTYETTIVRQMFTPWTGVGTGANLNQDNKSQTQQNWNRVYPNTMKELVDGIERYKEEDDLSNIVNMMRIWRAWAAIWATDTYGDVPYSEAGKGFLEAVSFPVYDTQQSIYDNVLNELSSAVGALDGSKRLAEQDIFYGGDVDQWKRLGNSLMLRAAMRLVKVDPGKAEDFAGRAISGGLMDSNDDNAVVRHNPDYRNPVGTNLNGGQAPFYYLDREFVNYLKDRNDPRLPRIAVRYVGAKTEGDQTEENADRSFDVQIGIPQGFEVSNINPQAESEGLASVYDYSQLDRKRLGGPEAPSFLVTYAQTLLLKAEAIVRGWASGDAAAEYAAAIRANMEQFSDWPGDTDISTEEIDAYIAANPLEADKEIEQINGQYWIASLLNGPEAWANFRRSGYPVVEPNPYPGNDLSSEDFIRRLTYPDNEYTVNRANIDAAVARQGADDLNTRVWWDVK